MAKNQSPKKASKTSKKAIAKRGVGKSTTPRKASKQLNQRRLQQDIAYYEEQLPTDFNRRVGKSKKNRYGVPLADLKPIYERGTNHVIRYESKDGSIVISPYKYQELSISRYAVPIYTPIHATRNGRRRIVSFRNSITGQTVTPYYYYNYFSKEFKREDTPELEERRKAYEEAVIQAKYTRLRRKNDLEESYAIVHPEYEDAKGHINRTAISRDPNFRYLVDRLEELHASAYVNQQVVREADIALGGTYDDDTVAEETLILKTTIGESKEYQDVLVQLGRRLPSDTNPVGESDPNHIKFTVRPYYEALRHQKTFEG